MIDIKSFCEKYDTSDMKRLWMLSNCKDMQEVWDTVQPEWLLWLATRKGVLSDKDTIRMSTYWANTVKKWFQDPRVLQAIDMQNKYCTGAATEKEVEKAWGIAGEQAQEAIFNLVWVNPEEVGNWVRTNLTPNFNL